MKLQKGRREKDAFLPIPPQPWGCKQQTIIHQGFISKPKTSLLKIMSTDMDTLMLKLGGTGGKNITGQQHIGTQHTFEG